MRSRRTQAGDALDRRALLVGGGSLVAATLSIGAALAQDAPPIERFRGVAVDTGPLAAFGDRGAAALIQRQLPAKMASVFADHLAPREARAPTLVARIDRIQLSGFADTPSPGFDAFRNLDSLEGAGLVVAGRRTLSETPLRVTLPASYSGAYYLPDIDERRIDSLCFQFASWLKTEMHL